MKLIYLSKRMLTPKNFCLMQEDYEFKDSLAYIVRFGLKNSKESWHKSSMSGHLQLFILHNVLNSHQSWYKCSPTRKSFRKWTEWDWVLRRHNIRKWHRNSGHFPACSSLIIQTQSHHKVCGFLYRSFFSSRLFQTVTGLDCHMIIKKRTGHGLTMAHLNCEFPESCGL